MEENPSSGGIDPDTSGSHPVERRPESARSGWMSAGLTALVLFLVLAFLFRESLFPGRVLFANDAPLGFIKHYFENGRDGWGVWLDHTWVGYALPAGGPRFTTFFSVLCAGLDGQGAVTFANFYAPVCLWVLGMCAWVFFRQLGCGSAVCLMGALAAALNGAFFTYAAWGLPVRALAAGMTFLALAALASSGRKRWWPLAVLAGLAVGQGVMEAYDIGALLSLYVAAFAVFIVLNTEGWSLKSLGKGFTVVCIMAVMAGLMAYHSIASVQETQTKGIVNREMSAEAKWDFATQWSLPKGETVRIAVPGLFGYRMDGPPEERYWGGVGRTSGWEEHKQGIPHHSGYGVYAGVPVLLVAFWCIVNAFRRDGPYTVPERSLIYFTAVLALISLGMAWGQHSVFFQLIHPLPFFKDIRNPIKFMQPFSLLVVILFGLGLQGLARLYLEGAKQRVREAGGTLKDLVNPVRGFEPAWFLGSVLGFVVLTSFVLAYTSSESDVVQHITQNRMASESDALAMASFSFGQALWALLVLFFSLVLLAVVSSGRIVRSNARVFWVLLGVLMVADLCRGNAPYIEYWQHEAKYPKNSILRFLADRPGHERMALLQNQTLQIKIPTTNGVFFRSLPLDTYLIDQLMYPQPAGNQVFTNDFQKKSAAGIYEGLMKYKTSGQLRQFQMRIGMILTSQNQGRGDATAGLIQELRAMPAGLAFLTIGGDTNLVEYFGQKLGERGTQLQTLDFANQLAGVYQLEWAQHQIPYHGVPTLDIVMEPRPTLADNAFRTNLAPAVSPYQAGQIEEAIRMVLRKWELTSTRYLLCLSGNTDVDGATRARFGESGYTSGLNYMLDPSRRRFNTVKSFGLEAVTNTPLGQAPAFHDPVTHQVRENTEGLGKIALVEFKGALPRAQLFADWRQGIADPEALEILASPGWNPHQQVILAEEGLPEPDMPAHTGQLLSVEYVANRAKYIELKTPSTEINTVLLLNDRHNPDWQVTVDGKPARLLRANFLMRGVHLEPSKEGHTVIFRYLPSTRPLVFSSVAGLIGLAFGIIGLYRREEDQ